MDDNSVLLPEKVDFIRALLRYEDHCSRAQKSRESLNIGPLGKLKDYLFGRYERDSVFSGLCGECSDIISDLRLYTIVNGVLKDYGEKIEEIQDYCIKEECRKALKGVKELIKEFRKNELL